MTSIIQIPNITINGNDYWDSHKSQYNAMIGESISPLTLDLKGYPTSNTISIVDPTEEYYYTDNNDEEIRNYPLTKNTNLNVKIGKMPEFWEVPRELTAQGEYQYPSSNFSVTLPDSVTEIEFYGLQSCFYKCNTIISFNSNNVSNIKSYGLENCFYQCTNLTTASTFASLSSIGAGGLQYCFCNTKITSISFPALTSTSFGTYKNQFSNMLLVVTGCTVHFPSNLQSVIGSWSSVTNGFGGTNTTVLFDLPATS